MRPVLKRLPLYFFYFQQDKIVFHCSKHRFETLSERFMSTFKFLVTTDNHLGFKDDDHIRCKDSYDSFEEALSIARDKDVDFVLLGGDLFHVNRPSASIEHKCIKIIRQHMNASNKRIEFKKISGSFSHCESLEHPNFEDENLNVSYPILTIHGNHDDPTGSDNQSVCEKLATSGLLNYFGLLSLKDNTIEVKPIVLIKDSLKLAIYGMGFIPDARLKIAFDKKEVVFENPPEDSFNILVTHQNRACVNKDRYIPDEYFPKFFHLIIRGHEHEAQPPQDLSDTEVNGFVWQPGSTVATSINFMESIPKKVGIVKVTKNIDNVKRPFKWRIDLIKLKSIRPMIVKNIFRQDIITLARARYHGRVPKHDERIYFYSQRLAEKYLNEIISKDYDKLPLVRLRIEYLNREERFDDTEIVMQNYNKSTANKDIVLFRKQKLVDCGENNKTNKTFEENSSLVEMPDDVFEKINLTHEKKNTIDAMIEGYFNDLPSDQRLLALSLKEYTRAVSSIDEGNVIGKVVKEKSNSILKEYGKALESENIAENLFSNLEDVTEWFTSKLKSSNNDFDKKQAGDESHENLLIKKP